MISALLLMILVGICLSMVVWTVRGRDRIFQYPFISAMSWLIFFVPQFVGIVRKPLAIPHSVLSAGGVELALTMTILCAAAGFIGYSRPVAIRWQHPRKWMIKPDRLFHYSIVMGLIALYGMVGLARLSGGFRAYFSTEGSYTLEWAGLPVYYNFFRMFIYPAALICLWSALCRPKRLKWAALILMMIVPFCYIVFLGRRSETFILIAGVSLCYRFRRGWTPPRIAVPLVILCAFLLMILGPDYRSHSQIGSDYSQILNIPVKDRIALFFSNEFPGEVTSACVVMTDCAEEWSYGLGRGFLRDIIYSLLPRMIVGNQVKHQLLTILNVPRDPFTKHSFQKKTGQFVTGPASAFLEFSFLGCLLYYLVGKGAHILWYRSISIKSSATQLLYAASIYLLVGTIIGSVTRLASTLMLMVMMWLPLLLAARMRVGYESIATARLRLGKATSSHFAGEGGRA